MENLTNDQMECPKVATPRILADDIFLLGIGSEGIENFPGAFEQTHEYITDIGATLAPDKSYTFATHQQHRAWLKTHKWKHINATIPTVLHTRDLGSHLNTTHRTISTTLTNRILQATKCVNTLRHIPITIAKKATIIYTKCLALALYGCEASHANEGAIRGLQNAICRTLGPRASNTANSIIFFASST